MSDPIETTVTLQVPVELLPEIQELLARHEAARVSGTPVPRKSIPLSYESSWTPVWRWWHAWPAVLALTLFVAPMAIAAWKIIPRYKMIFKDFGGELPGSTKILLAISDWVIGGWGWLILLSLAVLCPLAWNVMLRPSHEIQRKATRILIVLLFILASMFVAFSTVALNSPMTQFLDTINHGLLP